MTACAVACVACAVLYGLGCATFLALADEDAPLERRRVARMVPFWPLWIAGALALRAGLALRGRR